MHPATTSVPNARIALLHPIDCWIIAVTNAIAQVDTTKMATLSALSATILVSPVTLLLPTVLPVTPQEI